MSRKTAYVVMGTVLWSSKRERKKPVYIKEAYGLPRELTGRGEFRSPPIRKRLTLYYCSKRIANKRLLDIKNTPAHKQGAIKNLRVKKIKLGASVTCRR